MHESAAVILNGGVDAMVYYVEKMGGKLNPEVVFMYSGYKEFEHSQLDQSGRAIYSKLLASQATLESGGVIQSVLRGLDCD